MLSQADTRTATVVTRPQRGASIRELFTGSIFPVANRQLKDMKQIWEGDITEESAAWQLHCIIDQIHHWAIETFRPFILDHLEAWNLYLINNQASSLPMTSLNR